MFSDSTVRSWEMKAKNLTYIRKADPFGTKVYQAY
jgi:hypothetical protein